MNPYVATGLAMCLVIVVALVGTGYLAVYFTRRAKADVRRLLSPLAEMINGEADVEEAHVTGRWKDTMVIGRMANAAAGTVTMWQSDLIDSAGGEYWNFVYSRPNEKKQRPEEIEIVTESADLREWLETWTMADLSPIQPRETDWVQVEYSGDGGYIRIARPIQGRNGIPEPDAFASDLDFAYAIGSQNRQRQEALRTEVSE